MISKRSLQCQSVSISCCCGSRAGGVWRTRSRVNHYRTRTGTWQRVFTWYSDQLYGAVPQDITSFILFACTVYQPLPPALRHWGFEVEIKPVAISCINRRSGGVGGVKVCATHLKYRHTSACVSEVDSDRGHAEISPLEGLDSAHASRAPTKRTTSARAFSEQKLITSVNLRDSETQ